MKFIGLVGAIQNVQLIDNYCNIFRNIFADKADIELVEIKDLPCL